jgi:hypothetical protein
MMKDHRTQAGIPGLLLFLLLAGLCLVTCKEAPVCPKDEEPIVKDYRAYFWDGINQKTLYWYHTGLGEFDSVTIQWEITANPTVSSDGSLIYIPSGDTIKVLNTKSFSTVGEIALSAEEPVIVSPDGQYIAVLGDSTWIVRTSDYSVIHVDTALAFQGSFSSDSRTLYTSHFNLRRISFSDSNHIVSELINDDLSVRQAKPTIDDSELLIYYRVGTFEWAFGIFDLSLNMLVSYDLQQPGNGTFAMTPDGSRAYYGSPGDLSYPGNSLLTEYDIDASRVIKRINMKGLIEEFEPYETPVGEIAVSPDGLWLLGHIGPINQGQAVFRWNLTTERMEPSDFRAGRSAIGLTIQSKE